METFKTSRYKRHKKERSLKKVNTHAKHSTPTHTAAAAGWEALYPSSTSCFLPQRRGSESKEDGDEKPRRNVSWHDKSERPAHCSGSPPPTNSLADTLVIWDSWRY